MSDEDDLALIDPTAYGRVLRRMRMNAAAIAQPLLDNGCDPFDVRRMLVALVNAGVTDAQDGPR